MMAHPDAITGEFRPWRKIARLNREIVVTEKIDGTNACVIVTDDGQVLAQSRTRIITPAADNHGFAAWVEQWASELAADLGPGYHYGEWWGQRIQRGYGQNRKQFSLFNVLRWEGTEFTAPLDVVPVLYRGVFSQDAIDHALESLVAVGSAAAPGFMRPEGVVIYHVAANIAFKVTLERDEEPKGRGNGFDQRAKAPRALFFSVSSS